MLTLSGIPQNRIITVYAEEELEFQGYLLSWDAGHTLLACVDRYGENDGFLLLHTDSLYRVDYNSLYEQKLETLYLRSPAKTKHSCSLCWPGHSGPTNSRDLLFLTRMISAAISKQPTRSRSGK